jgi:hypothetical protein
MGHAVLRRFATDDMAIVRGTLPDEIEGEEYRESTTL